jgi:hypothetical protein
MIGYRPNGGKSPIQTEGAVTLGFDILFQRRRRALPMGGGLGFEDRGFGVGSPARPCVEIDEHAGNVDGRRSRRSASVLRRACVAGIDELARSGRG